MAVLEKYPDIGGINVSTGSVSKTLREAVMHLTGYRERSIYGESYAVKQHITLGDLMMRNNYVTQQHIHILRSQLAKNRIEMITAEGSFIDAPTPSTSRRMKAGRTAPSPPTRRSSPWAPIPPLPRSSTPTGG